MESTCFICRADSMFGALSSTRYRQPKDGHSVPVLEQGTDLEALFSDKDPMRPQEQQQESGLRTTVRPAALHYPFVMYIS